MSGWPWPALVAPYLASAALLVVAGAPKVLDPLPLVRAIGSVGLPFGVGIVRAFAGAETLLGVVALVWPTRWSAALVALAYLGFTAFVVLALRRGGVLESCGCFGTPDTPPTWAHAVVTCGAAVACAVVAVGAPAQPYAGASLFEIAPAVGGGGLVAFLAWQVMAVLPSVQPAAIRSISTARHRTSRRGPR